MGQMLGPQFPNDIGLAVSGGGDSMAMLSLAHNWAHVFGVRLWIATVDHGLRAESADEAAMVAQECAALGHAHATLHWDWDGVGNVQARAREARLGLIDRWRGQVSHVLMAHTRDDVAETFLMRLRRSAGVQGLSAIAPERRVAPQPHVAGTITGECPPEQGADAEDGFNVIRPCLDMRRDELRHYLRTLQGRWVDDPSNDDPTYDRVRMRNLLADLADEGLGVDALAGAAARMRRSRVALAARAHSVWMQFGKEDRQSGELFLDRGISAIEDETNLRILSAALQYVASRPYAPREAPLEALLDKVVSGGGGTLHGCEVRAERQFIRIFREYNSVADHSVAADHGQMWDGRWRVAGNEYNGLTLRALGDDGWKQVVTPVEGSPPFHAARALPSLWRGDDLVLCAALGVGHDPDRAISLCPMGMSHLSFGDFLLSH